MPDIKKRLLFCLIALSPVIAGQVAQGAVSVDPAVDPGLVNGLAGEIRARIQQQAQGASVDAIQGVAAFAIDQSGAADIVVVAALLQLLEGNLTPQQRLAVQNLLRVRGKGTAGLVEGTSLSLGQGPTGGGGGAQGSDYATP